MKILMILFIARSFICSVLNSLQVGRKRSQTPEMHCYLKFLRFGDRSVHCTHRINYSQPCPEQSRVTAGIGQTQTNGKSESRSRGKPGH
ncbi:hypothetical protein GDO86_017999 [Hymenochirus boettgeri]|uniref:Secreted protein n=1 Tax=Hymenochirus boettgeri TaxID=247094 RepID=A0A8T2IDD6_9PIPI|nr:hypothetical protein GDO86_017999 [Hymenochirus boettgeri]